MLEFFLALFGGAYYAGKFLTEKSANKAADFSREQRKKLQDECLSKYAASYELSQQVKKDVIGGDLYDYITTEFAQDFQFALGDGWKDMLKIPPKVHVANLKNYDSYFMIGSNPSRDIDWVYHLILAEHGKMDTFAMWDGYYIGGYLGNINARAYTNTSIKFAQCVERRLRAAGADIRLALELDMVSSSKRRTADDLTGGRLKLPEFCVFDTARLWR